MTRFITNKFIGLFLALLLSFSLSCFSDNKTPVSGGDQITDSTSNETPGSNEEIPDPVTMNRIIPPESTMQIDFSGLLDFDKSGVKCETPPDNNLTPAELLCIANAFALVAWSNAVCFTPLIIPIAIYHELKNQTPVEATDTHVEWSYIYTHNGTDYDVSVTADKNGGDYDWDWVVTIDGFEWITGSSMEDLSGGKWQYHDINLPPGANNSILVVWTRGDDFDGTIKFTNNTDDPAKADKKGDYIWYKRIGSDIEVNFYDINYEYDGSNDILSIKVYWNMADRTGGIIQNADNEVSYGECMWDSNE